jgi:hypothetical protein
MPYEVAPPELMEKEGSSSFKEIVRQQIVARGDENLFKPDPYQSQLKADEEFGTTTGMSNDGELEFGCLWQVSNVKVDSMNLVYAYVPPTIYTPNKALAFLGEITGNAPVESQVTEDPEVSPARAQFCVEEFGECGLAVRTSFVERGNAIHKTRASAPALSFMELNRPLRTKEVKALDEVMVEPEEANVALQGLIKLSSREQRQVRKAQKERREREEKHRRRLREIDEYHRRSKEEMLRNPRVYR